MLAPSRLLHLIWCEKINCMDLTGKLFEKWQVDPKQCHILTVSFSWTLDTYRWADQGLLQVLSSSLPLQFQMVQSASIPPPLGGNPPAPTPLTVANPEGALGPPRSDLPRVTSAWVARLSGWTQTPGLNLQCGRGILADTQGHPAAVRGQMASDDLLVDVGSSTVMTKLIVCLEVLARGL